MNRRKRKEKSRVAIIFLSIFLLCVIVVSSLHLSGFIDIGVLSGNDYNTGIHPSTINYMKTERFSQDVWKGNNAPGVGWPYKELLADEKYVTSFSGATGDDAYSERIAIQANVFEDAWIEYSYPLRAYYNVYIKTSPHQHDWTQIIGLNWFDSTKVVVTGGVGWRTTTYNPIGGGAQECWVAAMEIRLIGSVVGAIRVDARWEFQSFPFGPTWEKTMSRDYAYLISGEGSINIEGYSPYDVPMFEIGETVPIFVSADYSGATGSGTGRWQLWAFPLRGDPGVMLKEWTYDYFRETYHWTLPTDAWVRGSHDSRWELELRNTLFPTGIIKINTIDVRAKAPPQPQVLTLPDYPQVCQTITVHMSAPTNALTHEKIIKFIVRGMYPDTGYEFVDKHVAVDEGEVDPFIGTTTIKPPRSGVFVLQVWAHDEAGRQSEHPASIHITMREGKYRVTLTVVDEYDGLPIEGVRVERVGGDEHKFTATNGVCWFDVDQGTYSFQFTKAGYKSAMKSYPVASDLSRTVTMTRTTNTWNLAVTVYDDETKDTVWGATVKIGGHTMMTDSAGQLLFKTIPEGEYIVRATKDAKAGEVQVNLDRNRDIAITIYVGGVAPVPGILGVDYMYIVGIIVVLFAIILLLWYLKRKGYILKNKKRKKK